MNPRNADHMDITSTGKVLVISCITLCKININNKRPL